MVIVALSMAIGSTCQQIVRFKNGYTAQIRVMSIRHDTLFYKIDAVPGATFGIPMAQVDTLADIPKAEANKTLQAALSQCVLSFIFEGVGGALILADLKQPGIKMAVGVTLGCGGVGMGTNTAILTSHTYRQIQMLPFAPGDSLLRMEMMRHSKTARTLAIVQNIMPIVAATAGAISYTSSKNNTYDEFFESETFWVPVLCVCAVQMALAIPELVLIGKTKKSVDKYQQKVALGATKYGLGISYKFH